MEGQRDELSRCVYYAAMVAASLGLSTIYTYSMAHGCCSRCRKDTKHRHAMGICTCTHEPLQPYSTFRPKAEAPEPVTIAKKIGDLANPRIREMLLDRETAEFLKDDHDFQDLIKSVGMYGVSMRIMEQSIVSRSILLKYSDGGVQLLIHSPRGWDLVTVYARNQNTTLSTFALPAEPKTSGEIPLHDTGNMQGMRANYGLPISGPGVHPST